MTPSPHQASPPPLSPLPNEFQTQGRAHPPLPPFPPGRPRRRLLVWLLFSAPLLILLSAAVGAGVTYLSMRGDESSPSGGHQTVPSPITSTPLQVNAAESARAKAHLCQVFDLSVRGQQGQGGYRVEGDLNVPVTMRAINSAAAVQNAIVPAVPPDVAAAAHRYVNATLDATTAAMGNTPTPDLNRLTDAEGDAIYALADVCGLPR